VLDLRGDYALVKFGQVPTPNIWLRSDQLESF
jgi:Cyanobacterial and plant NDH-1 subunit O